MCDHRRAYSSSCSRGPRMTTLAIPTVVGVGLGLGLGVYSYFCRPPSPPWKLVVGPTEHRLRYEEDGPIHTIRYNGTLGSLRRSVGNDHPTSGFPEDQQRLSTVKQYLCSKEGFAALRLDKRCETSFIHDRVNHCMFINLDCHSRKSNFLISERIKE